MHCTDTIQILSEANVEYLKKNSRFLNKRAIPKGNKKYELYSQETKRSQNFRKCFFDTSSLKVPSFIYLYLLVEKLQRIKVKELQNFEGFLHP